MPVDDVDEACKTYIRGLQCITMDYPTCDLSNTDWSGYIKVPMTADMQLELQCSTNGAAEDCGYALCKVELQAFDDQQAAENSAGSNSDNKIVNGFDVTTDCVNAGNNVPKTHVDSCCGSFPYRMPYDSNYGARGCCAASGKTYDSTVYSCCNDGTIKN